MSEYTIRSSISLLLHDAARQLRARFDGRARDLGVTRQQWRVLLVLSQREGASQAELADRIEVERITLCRMIDRLADAGLVERREDPNDRRVWRLHLLPAAYPIVEQLSMIASEIEAETVSVLGCDAEIVRDNLTRLRDGLRDEAKRSAA